jgi:photosystem II stability/assembly factor-like uncharacterized protein
MKRKLLQLSLLTIVFGLAGLIVASGYVGSDQPASMKSDHNGIADATEYLLQIRSNQVTGEIDPIDVLKAREQAERLQMKSGNALGLDWIEVGPDNAPGRVRALIFEQSDQTARTIIAAGVTGGLWKTTNLGATWNKINIANENLYVSALAQAPDGTIYAGTGEYFCTDDETYVGGLVGQGIFKSTDGDVFTLIEETKPTITAASDTVDWAYINKISIDKSSGRVYAATNTGLWYSDNGNNGWNKVTQYYHDTLTYNVAIAVDSTVNCDSFVVDGNNIIMNNPQYNTAQVVQTSTREAAPPQRTIMTFGQVNCSDVEVANDGTVAATFGDLVFLAPAGSNLIFTNKSGTPTNPYLITSENRDYTTTLIAVDTLGNSASRTVTFNQVTPFVPDPALERPSPLANNPSRSQVAFAPSDDSGDIIYAVSTLAGFLYNVYLSEDKGETWEIVFPGGSTTLRPFNGSACFNNVFEVFPDNPYKVLLGGNFMWLGQRVEGTTGYFDWGLGPVTAFLPAGHHVYAFQPGTTNKLAVASNRGVSYGTVAPGATEFGEINRNFAVTQSYTVGSGGLKKRVLTGTQGDGTWYISGDGNTAQAGAKIEASNGGTCLITTMNPDAFIYSTSSGIIERSDDQGENTSFNFNPPTTTLFITPMALWEDYENENSLDSITFKALDTYYQGDVLIARSLNPGFGLDAGYPFNYILEADSLVAGDSLRIKDIIQSKLFIAAHNFVWMTKDAVKFGQEPEWFQIAAVQTAHGQPTAIAYSKDADYLFVGTRNGTILRISNIALAYNYERADIRSPFCVISTDVIQLPEFQDRFITSISVDQEDANHIIVTLGNYGNDHYVYHTTNALASPAAGITFTSITGNLPKMPVYSSIIEMRNSDIAIIGTEHGVYTTTDLGSGDVSWTAENSGVGIIPVFQIRQQTVYKDEFIIYSEDPTTPPLVYPRVDNWGTIYMATYGRGIFRDETYTVVGIDELEQPSSFAVSQLNIYPNPVTSEAQFSFELKRNTNVTLMIYNLNGQVVKNLNAGLLPVGKHNISMNCADLQSGAYIVKISGGKDLLSSKMIVQ